MSGDVRRARLADHRRPNTTFTDRVARLVASIDYRRADSVEDREAIFRLRYAAYRREGGISANTDKMFRDQFDDTDNGYLFGLYIGDQLATAIRLHAASSAHPDFPSLKVFHDYLQPELDAGKVLIDTTRFVADERLSRLHRGLPFATVRLCVLAAEHFNADHVLAAVRTEHQAWYGRSFNLEVVCEPRPYPQLAKPISLMTVNFPGIREEWFRRYPFFRSSAFERRRLFERRHPGDRQMLAEGTTRPFAGATKRPFLELGAA